jgi:putative ABC transport system substrate-binding protein
LPSKPLRDALRELGYLEGVNLSFDVRFAEGRLERLPTLAAELISRKPDVIVTQGGLATFAAKGATSTIPIVMAVAAGDAVATELIASLAHPGGNVTGMSDELQELSAKRMQLLKEAVPKATAIAVLWNGNDIGMTLRYREIDRAAQLLRVRVLPVSVRGPGDITPALEAMAARKPDAMFLVSDALTNVNRKQLLDFAAVRRIPAMYEYDFYVRDGGLMSYGPDNAEGLRRAASYVDRIFKGASPANLPAELPNRNYLAINLKTAASLGISFPQTLLARADTVIQ